jgi:hypothetical protein
VGGSERGGNRDKVASGFFIHNLKQTVLRGLADILKRDAIVSKET